MLDDITLYWLTNSATSAARLYWETGGQSVILAAAQMTAEISLPVAITVFPEEVYRAPETWARRAYRNLIYFNEVDKGGHFAAWEQPELFSAELRAALQIASLVELKTIGARVHARAALPWQVRRNIDRSSERHSSMKTNKLLVAAVLAIAIGSADCGLCRRIEHAAADDIHRDDGFRSFTDSPLAKLPVNPSWPLSSARTSGSIRRP